MKLGVVIGSGLILHGATDLLLMQDYLQLRQQEKGLRYSGLKCPSLVHLQVPGASITTMMTLWLTMVVMTIITVTTVRSFSPGHGIQYAIINMFVSIAVIVIIIMLLLLDCHRSGYKYHQPSRRQHHRHNKNNHHHHHRNHHFSLTTITIIIITIMMMVMMITIIIMTVMITRILHHVHAQFHGVACHGHHVQHTN